MGTRAVQASTPLPHPQRCQLSRSRRIHYHRQPRANLVSPQEDRSGQPIVKDRSDNLDGWKSVINSIPLRRRGRSTSSSSGFQAIGLGFTILFFFFKVGLGGGGGVVRVCDRFFNSTIEVVTFRLRGWCMLGVFLLLAFPRLGHGCQDLLSLCYGMHVTRPRFVLTSERDLGEWSQNPC